MLSRGLAKFQNEFLEAPAKTGGEAAWTVSILSAEPAPGARDPALRWPVRTP